MNKITPKTLVIATTACFLGVILAIVGAELPDDTSFAKALPFWLTVVCTTALLMTTVSKAIGHLVGDSNFAPFFKVGVVGAITIALVTIPIALMCLPIEGLMPDADSLIETSDAADPMSAFFLNWADQYLNLLPGMAGFWLFLKALDFAFTATSEAPVQHSEVDEPGDRRSMETEDPDGDQQMPRPSALERRFPEISGRKLLAIEADEHYVRLHTDVGSKHVLYRFRDALKDVEELAGLRVHRSWWVAEDAMEGLEQNASSYGLRLKGGLKAPVSQTYRRDVEKVIEARSTLS